MAFTTAIFVDDRADQRQLFTRVLGRAGWQAHTASGSLEAEALVAHILGGPDAAHTVILLDLHMLADPYAGAYPWLAGAYLALRLRARMQWGELPRAPIVGLSSLLSHEMFEAALAFGCDAVLEKDPPLDLAARVTAALAQDEQADGLTDLDATLRLARPTPAPALEVSHARRSLSTADVSAALAAYRRHGLEGLSHTALAHVLAPEAADAFQRAQAAYSRILHYLDKLERQGAVEMAANLRIELQSQLTPLDHQAPLTRSQSSYYRLRRAAAQAFLELLASEQDIPPLERTSML